MPVPVRPPEPIFAARHLRSCALTALGCLAVLVLPARLGAQQSADAVLAAARDHYVQQTREVEDYTIVEQVNGERQVAYFERREANGHPAFVPAGALSLVLQSGALDATPLGALSPGGVLPGLKNMLEQSAARAGMAELQQQIQGMGKGVFADFIGPLLTPAAGGGPASMLASLSSPDHLKQALLEGAKRAAVHEVEQLVLHAAAGQFAGLLEAMQAEGGPKQLLGQLGSMVAKGQLPTPSGSGYSPVASQKTMNQSQMLLGAAGAAMGAYMQHKISNATQAIANVTAHPALDLQPYDLFDQLTGHASLQGTEDVDGHASFVLAVSDFSGLPGVDTSEFRPGGLTVWIDHDLYMPRRVQMKGQAHVEGKWTPVTLEIHQTDYHQTHGLVLPRTTSMTVSGMNAAMSDKDRAEMQKKMAEAQKQIAKLPPQQRAMVEQMMKTQMPQLEAMTGGKPVETVVTDVKVNQGPPDELVQQAKTMIKMTKGGGSGG